MPLYTVSTRAPVSDKAKAEIAMMITDEHCGPTGAPRTFVQVFFSENVPLNPGTELHLFASVRAGRTMQVNDNIEQAMVNRLCEITGFGVRQIETAIFGVPASWIMEGGVILPEPGEEAEWLKKHNHAA